MRTTCATCDIDNTDERTNIEGTNHDKIGAFVEIATHGAQRQAPPARWQLGESMLIVVVYRALKIIMKISQVKK